MLLGGWGEIVKPAPDHLVAIPSSEATQHLKNLVCRRYTKFYGTHGDAAADIAHDAIIGNILCPTPLNIVVRRWGLHLSLMPLIVISIVRFLAS